MKSTSTSPTLRSVKSYEVLREVFKGSSPKQIADVTGLSLSMIYKWSEEVSETGSGATNPLDRIERIIKATDDPRLVQWICEQAGGFFINNPDSAWPQSDALIPATNQILQDFADLLSVVAHAAADNHITADEAKRIRTEWESLKSATEGFVKCCEEGNFRGVAENAKEIERRHTS